MNIAGLVASLGGMSERETAGLRLVLHMLTHAESPVYKQFWAAVNKAAPVDKKLANDLWAILLRILKAIE